MPPKTNPNASIKKVVEAARKWLRSRTKLRAAMAKKASAKSVERLRKAHIADADKLEAAVLAFEKIFTMLQRGGASPKRSKGPSKPFPWKDVLGVAAAGLGALDKVVNTQAQPEYVKATVIDDDGNPVR
jgi:hypothetical protein